MYVIELFLKIYHKLLASRNGYTYLAVATFFLIITAQTFWYSIHGDGAVYAILIRSIGEAGLFSGQLPKWTVTDIFAEHPYLFFYFSTFFTSLFGYSDLAIKIPNFAIAAVTVILIYKFCIFRIKQGYAHQVGLVAGYVLILNATYMMQISQPTLDPMAQLLSLISIGLFIYYDAAVWAGVFLGLAFLTKGLEILPHLAALGVISIYLNFRNYKVLVLYMIKLTFGLLLPVMIWLSIDYFVWHGDWLKHYWDRQFTNRFFSEANAKSTGELNFLITFLNSYCIEISILVIGVLKSKLWPRKSDIFYMYFLWYTFFNILAFVLIKKNSSQHLTGIFIFGSIIVSEYLWEFYLNYKRTFLKHLPILFFVLSLVYWVWFIVNNNKNPDTWTALKKEAQTFKLHNKTGPIVVVNAGGQTYGVYFTAQWYFYPHKIYYESEANLLLKGQDVYVLDQFNKELKSHKWN